MGDRFCGRQPWGLTVVPGTQSLIVALHSPQITVEAWVRPTTIATTNNQDRVVSKQGAYELTVSTGDTGCGFGTNGTVGWATASSS